jgi:hypothetical protein
MSLASTSPSLEVSASNFIMASARLDGIKYSRPYYYGGRVVWLAKACVIAWHLGQFVRFLLEFVVRHLSTA